MDSQILFADCSWMIGNHPSGKLRNFLIPTEFVIEKYVQQSPTPQLDTYFICGWSHRIGWICGPDIQQFIKALFFSQPSRRIRMFLSLYYSLFINPQYCFRFWLCCRIMTVSLIFMHTLTCIVLLKDEISKRIHYPPLVLLLWKKTGKWYASVIADRSAGTLWLPLWLFRAQAIKDSGRGWGNSGR